MNKIISLSKVSDRYEQLLNKYFQRLMKQALNALQVMDRYRKEELYK